MKKYYIVTLSFFLITNVLYMVINSSNNKNNIVEVQPFSFEEILQIPVFSLKKPLFIQASDGIDLALYSFLPDHPSKIIIFYHGGGFYTNSTYQYIGKCLQEKFNIGSYFVDIRGHGNSGGPRGDSPSINQVFDDVTRVLEYVYKIFPNIPVSLVGHSSGAGLLINYSTYKYKRSDLYSKYIFLSPYLGPFVGVERLNAPIFVKDIKIWIYILNKFLKTPLFRHVPVFSFNYPKELLNQDPLILSYYTYTMSCATTPENPRLIFEQLDKPSTIFIGQNDEQFTPEKIIAFANYNKKGMVVGNIIPNAKHLSILLNAPKLIDDVLK